MLMISLLFHFMRRYANGTLLARCSIRLARPAGPARLASGGGEDRGAGQKSPSDFHDSSGGAGGSDLRSSGQQAPEHDAGGFDHRHRCREQQPRPGASSEVRDNKKEYGQGAEVHRCSIVFHHFSSLFNVYFYFCLYLYLFFI